jgi:hypothetical protein
MSVALYMDENVHAAITSGLRFRGADVLTVQEDGLAGAEDGVVLDRALALARVLFTQDQDFLIESARRQAAGEPFGGVIYAHDLLVSIGTCISDLELIALLDNPEDHANLLTYLPL